jgi:2-methylcitrate dehydratase PrpD
VEARATDGRSEMVQVRVSPGYPSRELSWSDIEHKFMDCAAHGGLKAEQARRAFDALAASERADNVSAIVRLMTLA